MTPIFAISGYYRNTIIHFLLRNDDESDIESVSGYFGNTGTCSVEGRCKES